MGNKNVEINTESFTPSLAIDCVVFGFHENELKVLLLKLTGVDLWALPGGFVHNDKDIDEAAIETLRIRTGLTDIFLRQFHTFGSIERNDPSHPNFLIEKGLISKDLFDWFNQRFVSIGYYALVEFSQVKEPVPGPISEACEWCSLNDLPTLMLDHKAILDKAYKALKKELSHQPVGLNLLPKQFTMSELQALYETILDRQLDRRNFRRKILSYGILKDTKKFRTGVAHKAPALYEFDVKAYQKANDAGLMMGW